MTELEHRIEAIGNAHFCKLMLQIGDYAARDLMNILCVVVRQRRAERQLLLLGNCREPR
jgi:hypothetical protein